MPPTNALAQRPQTALELNDQAVDIIRQSIAPDLTPPELAYFVEVAKRQGLDPLKREIYAQKRFQDGKPRITFVTGIDAFRRKAQETGDYGGKVATEWCGKDGRWRDIWLDDEAPAAARVSVKRRSHEQPTTAVALYREYVQTRRDGTPNSMWQKMPANQLAKCAEALALRQAFPDQLGGIYTGDEMGQADNPAPAPSAAPRFSRQAPRPIPQGNTVALPGHQDPEPVQEVTDGGAEAESDAAGDGDNATAEALEVVVALASELLLKTNAAAKKLGPSPAVDKKAREYVERLLDKNCGYGSDQATVEDLQRMEQYLRGKIEEVSAGTADE